MKVSVNPPKTPVTQGSNDVAAATLPNVCKMPGPPAPFVPTPLPNIGKSGNRLKKFTTKVFFEGKKVAVKGSYYMSIGDIASKATGGGLLSAATHGKTEFVAPGSMNVKAQGKNVQLLGDAMTNNAGSPANSATLPGNIQATDAFKKLIGDDDVALALCKAACQAIEDKKDPKNKTQKNQNLMRQALDPKAAGKGGKRGAGLGLSQGLKKGVLTEVSQAVGEAGKFIGKWGAAVGTRGAPFVKWDIVLTAVAPGSAAPPLTTVGSTGVDRIVEVKFPKDSLTGNQDAALNKLSPEDQAKVVEMTVADHCVCA